VKRFSPSSGANTERGRAARGVVEKVRAALIFPRHARSLPGYDHHQSIGKESNVGSQERRFRILMVDDDPMACEIVSKGLASYGHTVRARTAALGTLADIRADTPDVLLLDFSMPGLSGDKLLHLVREIFPYLRVVLYTSADTKQLPERAKQAHMVIRKGPPEHLASLLQHLR
jgi:CheY-like chemotaxis protein